MITLEYINNLSTELDRDGIFSVFNGQLNSQNVLSLMKIIDQYFQHEPDGSLKRRISQVLVEILQNISRHGIHRLNDVPQASTVVLSRSQTEIIISTCSIMNSGDSDFLIGRIERINSLALAELNEWYRVALRNNNITEKGGAGLGLIEIARKSGSKILYTINKKNEHLSVLSMLIKINIQN